MNARAMPDPLRSLKAQVNRARSKQITDMLVQQLVEAGIPAPRREYRFYPGRKWRIDLCWITGEHRLAVEIEGGTWSGGRHTARSGYHRDLEKYNALTLRGYRLIRVTPDMIESSHEARDLIVEAFGDDRL